MAVTEVINRVFTLVITGTSLLLDNRIILVDASGSCGVTSQDVVKVVSPPGIPTGGTSALNFAGIQIASLGSYKICWWHGLSESDVASEYASDLGTVTVEGPATTTANA
jgi:hypothetical protein